MNRKDIEAKYRIENGIIKTLGKFEGEMLYVPYFWDEYLNGMADRDDGKTIGFNLTKEEKTMFPELKGRRTIKLYKRDSGFVCEC